MASKGAQSSAYEIGPYGSDGYHGDVPVATNPQGQSYIQVRLWNLTELPATVSDPTQRNGPMRLKGYRHIFDPWTTVKWGFPNFYRKPGLGYQKLGKNSCMT